MVTSCWWTKSRAEDIYIEFLGLEWYRKQCKSLHMAWGPQRLGIITCMEIRDEMQKGKAECLEDNSPASTWTSELCYGATCNIKKKYRSKSAIIQTKLKFQNYLDNWINVREQWYDQEKAQGDFSIWTKEAQCSIVCLYPKTRFFQVSPEKEINTALRNGHWVPVATCEDTETNFTASGACSYL